MTDIDVDSLIRLLNSFHGRIAALEEQLTEISLATQAPTPDIVYWGR